MSFLKQTPADPRNPERLPGDLDRLLRAFFRTEMPEPWPVLEPPADQPFRSRPVAPRRRSLVRSRLALAASLLFLLLGPLYLSSKFADSASLVPDPPSGGGIADKSKTQPGPRQFNKPFKAPVRGLNRGALQQSGH